LTPLPAKRLDPLYRKGYNELENSVIKPLWISRFFLSLRYTGAFLSCGTFPVETGSLLRRLKAVKE
jgi:hypothetical protein